MSSFIVFAVENADRMVLMGPPVAGKPTFKSIALSFIQAPKQAKRTATGDFAEEESCAYDAAELIRAAFIGKPVKFSEDYFIDPLQRTAGRLSLASGEDASSMLLKAGLAIVPERIPPRMDKALFDKYMKLMTEARGARRGLFAPNAEKNVRCMVNLSAEELAAKVEEAKGKEFLVRVERALSATALLLSASHFGHTQIPVHMTGISAKELDVGLDAQAKLHTERMLLNRNVTARFDGMDSYGNVLISIVSPKGCFQEELLSKGLAKLKSSTLSHSSMLAKMQAAEEAGKKAQAGTWKGYDAVVEAHKLVVINAPVAEEKIGMATVNQDGSAGPKYLGPQQFNGVLVQVVHGDVVIVREEVSGQHIRLSLAGVRASKNIERNQDGNAPEARVTYNDYAWEAKDFLRAHFIGQRVFVNVEYARTLPDTKEVRPAATITIPETDANIGAALLEEGLANYFLGKTDSCSTAPTLQAAEERAREQKKGLHSDIACVPTTVVELNRLGESRSRYYLSFLQRGMQSGRPPVLRGVVDLVLGPSSLRVYIPKEHFQIPVKVAGVITPSIAFNPREKSDAFAEVAKDYVIGLIQQREVTVQVYAADRGGNFISSVCLLDGTNLSVSIASAGFGTVGVADRLPFAQQLLDAEEFARSEKRNIWSEPGNIPQRAAKLEAERAASNPHLLSRITDESASYQSYTLTEVSEDGLSVFLQPHDTKKEDLRGKIQSLINATASSPEYIGKKGELIVSQYQADKTWCRARVVQARKDGSLLAQFIDFGNTVETRAKHCRAIPRGPEYAIVRETPAYVHLAHLAFVKISVPNDSCVHAAYSTAYDYSDGEVLAKAVYKDGSNGVFYSVTVNENVPSLSETLLQNGFAVLDRRASTVNEAEYKRHAAAQEIARKGHKGLWHYGDIDDEEEQ